MKRKGNLENHPIYAVVLLNVYIEANLLNKENKTAESS